MKHIVYLTGLLVCVSVSACASNLSDRLYDYSISSGGEDRSTGFVALSNLHLTRNELEKFEKDYLREKDLKNKYYYEYLLAKRTQDEKYIKLFIENSWNNIPELVENRTNWISIESPFYKQLAYYARVNQSALELVFKLVKIADGSILSVISSDLFDIKNVNPNAFYEAATKVGISEQELNNLMEDE